MSKYCKFGHIKGSDLDCPACKISRYVKERHKNPSLAMVAAKNKNFVNLQSEEAKAKREAYFKSDLHKSRARENALLLVAKRKTGEISPQIKTHDTKPELAVASTLDAAGIRFVKQQVFGPYTFDFYLPDYKILLEVQGEYWHSLPKNIANDLAKAAFIENNYQDLHLKYVSERETITKGRLITILGGFIGITQVNKEDVDLAICEVKIIRSDIAKDFLAKYHYLPRFRKNTKACFGVYYTGKLISVVIFAQPSYNTAINRHGLAASAVVELSRFVISDSYHTKNLASWALSRCIRLLRTRYREIALIISFADPHFGHIGTIYKASNWIFDGNTKPSYYYKDSYGGIIHKKVIWDHAQKFGISENNYANMNNLIKIITEPKKRFVYWLTKPSTIAKGTMQVKATCVVCNEEFLVSKKALDRAMLKNNSYICHPCSVSRCWDGGVYENRPKSTKIDR